MNVQLRKNTIPRISRKTADSVIRVTNTIFGEEVVYLVKVCNKCKEPQSVHNFYVKKYRQHIEQSKLTLDDFRNTCIICHDMASIRNKRLKRASKSNRIKLDIFQLESYNG